MTASGARPFPIPFATGGDKVAEPTDPYAAQVVSLPTPGYDGLAAMGRAFVEEFAMAGWPRERIARLFRVPRYAAAYAVYQHRGAEFVEKLIDSVLSPSPGTGEVS